MTDTQTLEGAVALLQRAERMFPGRHNDYEVDAGELHEWLPGYRAFLALPVSPDLPAPRPLVGSDRIGWDARNNRPYAASVSAGKLPADAPGEGQWHWAEKLVDSYPCRCRDGRHGTQHSIGVDELNVLTSAPAPSSDALREALDLIDSMSPGLAYCLPVVQRAYKAFTDKHAPRRSDG